MQTGRLPYTGILQKKPSSFRLQRKPLIILILQAEGCFRYLSAKLHFIWRRTENRSPEIEKSFGWELFTAFRNERKLKDTWNILHSVIHYKITLYSKYWKMKEIFFKLLEREAWGDMTAFRKECLNHHIVSNNVETIEEYDRMVGIEIPDNLKQNLIKSPIVLLNISIMLW